MRRSLRSGQTTPASISMGTGAREINIAGVETRHHRSNDVLYYYTRWRIAAGPPPDGVNLKHEPDKILRYLRWNNFRICHRRHGCTDSRAARVHVYTAPVLVAAPHIQDVTKRFVRFRRALRIVNTWKKKRNTDRPKCGVVEFFRATTI